MLPLKSTKANHQVMSSHRIYYLPTPNFSKTSSKQYWVYNSFFTCLVVPWVSLVITVCLHSGYEPCLWGRLGYMCYLHTLRWQNGKHITPKKKKNQREEEKNTCVRSFDISCGFFRDMLPVFLIFASRSQKRSGLHVSVGQRESFWAQNFLGMGGSQED